MSTSPRIQDYSDECYVLCAFEGDVKEGGGLLRVGTAPSTRLRPEQMDWYGTVAVRTAPLSPPPVHPLVSAQDNLLSAHTRPLCPQRILASLVDGDSLADALLCIITTSQLTLMATDGPAGTLCSLSCAG